MKKRLIKKTVPGVAPSTPIQQGVSSIATEISKSASSTQLDNKPDTDLRDTLNEHGKKLSNLSQDINAVNLLITAGFIVLAVTVASLVISIFTGYRNDVKQLQDDRYQLLQERIDLIESVVSKPTPEITKSPSVTPEIKKN